MPSRTSQKSHTHLSGSRRVMSYLFPLVVMSDHRMPEVSVPARDRLGPPSLEPSGAEGRFPRKPPSTWLPLAHRELVYRLRPIRARRRGSRWYARRGRFPVLGLLEQVIHRPLAHLVVRERHGGEGRRPQVGGNELLVVEADYRDVFGDAETPLLERLVGSHGHRVVATEDGRRGVRDPHQLCGATVPAVRGAVAVTDQGTVDGSTMRIERLFVPLHTSSRGRDTRRKVYEAHPFMSFTQEDLSSCATTRDLIRNHGSPGSVLREAVEQDGRRLPGVGGRPHGPVVHSCIDDALHPALKHHPNGGLLDLQVLTRVDYRQNFAGLPGRLLRAPDDVPGERGRSDLVGDKADGVRPVRAQQPRRGVRPITELMGGRLDPGPRSLGDGPAADVVEHEGHGGRGDAGQPRDVANGWRTPRLLSNRRLEVHQHSLTSEYPAPILAPRELSHVPHATSAYGPSESPKLPAHVASSSAPWQRLTELVSADTVRKPFTKGVLA